VVVCGFQTYPFAVIPSVAAYVLQLLLQANGPTSFHLFAEQTPSSASEDNVSPVAHRSLIELEQ